jgi:hypothetical protein
MSWAWSLNDFAGAGKLPAKSGCVVAAMGEGKSIDKNLKEIKLCR